MCRHQEEINHEAREMDHRVPHKIRALMRSTNARIWMALGLLNIGLQLRPMNGGGFVFATLYSLRDDFYENGLSTMDYCPNREDDRTTTGKPFLQLDFFSPNRSDRFPSVDDRVKFYMGHWYSTPCDESNGFQYVQQKTQSAAGKKVVSFNISQNDDAWSFTNVVQSDHIFVVDPLMIRACTHHNGAKKGFFRSYCRDIDATMVKLMLGKREKSTTQQSNTNFWTTTSSPPVLIQLGDLSTDADHTSLVHFKKFRHRIEKLSLECLTRQSCTNVTHYEANRNAAQPIVWLLNKRRHYKGLPRVEKEDVPWDQKKNQAIFRGGLTGTRGLFLNQSNAEFDCMLSQRCRLVYFYHNSSMIDAKHTTIPTPTFNSWFPDSINGRRIHGETLHMKQMLKYKALIMLEGNDVSSGLKWGMFSNSVVIMPRPTKSTWAMEELLEPWIHYVPIQEDLSDVENQMKWILDHPDKAQAIVARAKQWIRDLILSKIAVDENHLVMREIMRRYQLHFQPSAAVSTT